MRKWIAAAGIIILAGVMSVSSKKKHMPEKTLHSHSLEMIDLMQEMAGNESYRNTFSVSQEVEEILNEVAESDYTYPDEMITITFSDESLDAMIADLSGSEDLEEMSEEMKDFLKDKTLRSLVSQLNGKSGAEYVAASSICTVHRNFVNQKETQNVIYFYDFDDAWPVAVVFITGEGGAVEATASYVFNDEMKDISSWNVHEFFYKLGGEIDQYIGG